MPVKVQTAGAPEGPPKVRAFVYLKWNLNGIE